MTESVVVISSDLVLTSILQRLLSSFDITIFKHITASLDLIYNHQPSLLILDIDENDTASIRIINDLKEDPVLGRLPIVAIFPADFAEAAWDDLLVDDFIRRSDIERDILLRVQLCLARAERVVEINPLTRLPGNITISRQIMTRLDRKETFALAYADLDFFKPFNDKYGFGRGDEVLKMVGRLMLNLVREQQPYGSFVGHIGGDDFVFIMDVEKAEFTAKQIIFYHEQIILTFYDMEDRQLGGIVSVDREGQQKSFPFISLSIGIAHNRFRKYVHYGEMIEVASEMKKHAKKEKGSACSIDRRMPERKKPNQRA
jgi:diguanylate cyclase (GGDEF)-like protein